MAVEDSRLPKANEKRSITHDNPGSEQQPDYEILPPTDSLSLSASAAPGGSSSPNTINQKTILQMQQTSGNASVLHMLHRSGPIAPSSSPSIQRDKWSDLFKDKNWDPFGPKDNKPKEANWETAPAASADDLALNWNEQPFFPLGYSAHEKTPELDAGKTTFQGDWKMLATSWNSAATLANQYHIQAKLPEAYVESINGKPTAPPPKQLIAKDTDYKSPSGDYQIGSIFDQNNQLDMKTPFDPNKLKKGADRATYNAKVTGIVTARNNREKAGIVIEDGLTGVKSAWSRLRQAQIKEKQAEKTVDGKELTTQKTIAAGEKAEIETIIKGAEGVLGAGIKKDPLAAISATAGTMNALYYDGKINEIDKKLTEIDTAIAKLQVSYEMENVKQAKNDINKALNAVKSAMKDFNTASQVEKEAYELFSQTIETLGKKMGLSPDALKTLKTAAAGLPFIEETIGQFTQIQAVIAIPGYTSSSGIGAGLINNLDSFKSHLSILKAYQIVVTQAKVKWEERHKAAQSGLGVPGQTTTPPPPSP